MLSQKRHGYSWQFESVANPFTVDALTEQLDRFGPPAHYHAGAVTGIISVTEDSTKFTAVSDAEITTFDQAIAMIQTAGAYIAVNVTGSATTAHTGTYAMQ